MQGEVIALAKLLADKLSQLRQQRHRANEEVTAVEQELGFIFPMTPQQGVPWPVASVAQELIDDDVYSKRNRIGEPLDKAGRRIGKRAKSRQGRKRG